MNKAYSRIVKLLFLIIIVVLLRGFGKVFVQYLTVGEIGQNFLSAFWADFSVSITTQTVSFFCVFILMLINLFTIRHIFLSMDESFSWLKKKLPLAVIAFFFALVIGNIISYTVSPKVLPFLNSQWFSFGDPIFNNDIGYYVFQRPFYKAVTNSLSITFLITAILTALLYIIFYARLDFYNLKSLLENRAVLMHNLINFSIFFISKIATYKFSIEDMLFRNNGDFTGAGYVDVKIWTVYYRLMPYLTFLLVVVIAAFVYFKKYKRAVFTIAAFPCLWIAAGLIASFVQSVVVAPNELSAESPYIAHSIEYTRKAYNIDAIDNIDFDIEYDLTSEDIENNQDTINNIRIIDYDQTLTVFNQNQVINPYYSFHEADIVPYEIDGEKRAVMVAAREMNHEKLDKTAKNYINEKMKYTHGSGVVMCSINSVTEEGLPEYLIKDIPSKSLDGAPSVQQPRIYYGELTDDYVIVNTKNKELDDINEEYSYSGDAGIRMTTGNRLLFSILKADFNMLISSEITADSRLLINREITERIETVAPFLKMDDDPYIVIDDDGNLKWIVDCYTTSYCYPYSPKTDGYNYIRNSVKAVVDAYSGDVSLYIIDDTDPIIKAYKNIYPNSFEKGDLPESLASHTKYPEYLFTVQADILQKYHITNTSDFYQKKGVWSFATEKYTTDSRQIIPYYNLMKLSDDGEAELVMMLPYTLVGKDNMVSLLLIRCEQEHYGELICYNLPSNHNINGPAQIDSSIDADDNISASLTLWSQNGSNVVRGNMIIIPIENSLLYVEPVYIAATGEASIPLVKRVIVAYDNKVIMTQTVDEALDRLFGYHSSQEEPQEEPINQLISDAVNVYNDYKKAASEGNWTIMGEKQQELENAINGLSDYLDTHSDINTNP